MRTFCLLAFGAALAAGDSCPEVVPASVEFFLPKTLPAGMRPHVVDQRLFWVFCGPKGSPETNFQVRPDGDVALLIDVAARAHPRGDYANPWPNLRVRTVNAEVHPPFETAAGYVEVVAQGQTARVLVRATFTDRPIIRAVDPGGYPALSGDNENGDNLSAGPLRVWFDNADAPLPFTVATDSDWISVRPASGSGYTTIFTSLDFSKPPGDYLGNIIVTAPGAVNSPYKVPVHMYIEAPEFSPPLPEFKFSGVAGGTSPQPQSAWLQSIRKPLNATLSADAAWVKVSPASGTTPFQFEVSVNAAGLAAGTYTAKLTASAEGVKSATTTVTLTLSQP